MSIEKKIRKHVRDEISNVFDSKFKQAVNLLKTELKKGEKIKRAFASLDRAAQKAGKKLSDRSQRMRQKYGGLHKNADHLIYALTYGLTGSYVAEEIHMMERDAQRSKILNAARELKEANKVASKEIELARKANQ